MLFNLLGYRFLLPGYLVQPVAGIDRQGCERFLKATDYLCWSWQ